MCVNKRKDKHIKIFFLCCIMRHEESPEKPQCNMATPPFLDTPLPHSHPPSSLPGGGGRGGEYGVELCREGTDELKTI